MATPLSPVEGVGLFLLGVYLFITFSRILDVTLFYLKIPIIIFVLLNFRVLLSGRFFRLFHSRGGIALTLYTGWTVITSVLGDWRTGSIDSLNIAGFSGVGPGNFPVAYWTESKSQGKPAAWNVSHNSYTQVSSEMGIPGFIVFAAMLFYSFRTTVECLK
ncbi:MAG: hypothetical protein ABJB49_04840 [Nitrospirota bacterium]